MPSVMLRIAPRNVGSGTVPERLPPVGYVAGAAEPHRTRSGIVTDSDARLDAIRREIDALDAELLHLLNRRGRAVFEVAEAKGRETAPRYYRPEREAALLRRLGAINEGPLPDAEVLRLFREIISTCRALEQRLVIGCTTVEEACAAMGHFGGAVDLHALSDAAEALGAVTTDRCDYTMIEFSQAGVASPAVAELPDRGLSLCGEWYARGGERFVVIGRGRVPPTGDDWTSFILPTEHVTSIESWCKCSNLHVRSTPVAGRMSSSIVDVATHVNEPRLVQLAARFGGEVLGTYPDSRAGVCPE